MRLAHIAGAALLVLVPACGGRDAGVTEAAAARLQPEVQALREAAAAGSRDAANHELADLRRLVEELSATEELSEGGARRILAAAEQVEANLALLATTTTAPPTTTTTTAPPPPPPEERDEEKEKENDEQEEQPEETVDPPVGEDTAPGDTAPGKDNGGKGND